MVEKAEVTKNPEPQIVESAVVNVSATFLRQEVKRIPGIKPYVMMPGMFPETTTEQTIEFEDDTFDEMVSRAHPDDWGMRMTRRTEGKLREPDGNIRNFTTEPYSDSTVYFDAKILTADDIRRLARQGREDEVETLLAQLEDSKNMKFVITRTGDLKPFGEKDLIVQTQSADELVTA